MFDFGGIYVHAAGDDHVGHAVGQEHVPVGVDVAHVAHREDARSEIAGIGLVGRLVITKRLRGVPGAAIQRAHFTGVQAAAIVADCENLDPRKCPTHRARPREPFGRVDQGERAAFAGAPVFDEAWSPPVDHRPFGRRRDRRRAVQYDRQGRGIERAPGLVG